MLREKIYNIQHEKLIFVIIIKIHKGNDDKLIIKIEKDIYIHIIIIIITIN